MWIWLWLRYFSNRIYLNGNWNWVLVCEATQLKISIKRHWFSWHLDRNCPLKTLEKAFQSIKSSKFSGVACPLPLVWARTLSAPVHSSMIEKCLSWFHILKRLDSLCGSKVFAWKRFQWNFHWTFFFQSIFVAWWQRQKDNKDKCFSTSVYWLCYDMLSQLSTWWCSVSYKIWWV